MSTREMSLIGVIVLLVGILAGLGIATLGGDDDNPETVTEAAVTTVPETTTTAAPTTEAPATTAAPETTTTTVAPTTTAAPETTTTTEAPDGDGGVATGSDTITTPAPPAPLANASNGEVLGLAVDTNFEDVLAAVVGVWGAPDNDTGWTNTCILAGDGDNDRIVTWGNFRIRASRWEGPEVYRGFIYQRGAAGNFDPTGPTPDDVVFPPGGAWNQTLAEFIAATGAEEQLWGADFGFATADWGEGGNFRTVEPNVDAFMTYASWNPGDLCD